MKFATIGMCIALLGVGLANQAKADKVLSGSIAVGGAFSGWPTQTDRFNTTAHTVMGEVHLCLAPQNFLGAKLDLNVRHMFSDLAHDSFWSTKRRLNAVLTVPVPNLPGVTLFADYERYYTGFTNDLMMVGARLNF